MSLGRPLCVKFSFKRRRYRLEMPLEVGPTCHGSRNLYVQHWTGRSGEIKAMCQFSSGVPGKSDESAVWSTQGGVTTVVLEFVVKVARDGEELPATELELRRPGLVNDGWYVWLGSIAGHNEADFRIAITKLLRQMALHRFNGLMFLHGHLTPASRRPRAIARAWQFIAHGALMRGVKRHAGVHEQQRYRQESREARVAFYL